MTPEERERFVAWWLYESGREVDEPLEIAVELNLPESDVLERDPLA